MNRSHLFMPGALSILLLLGCNFTINKSITIEDGSTVQGSRNTINGNIFVGSDCNIQGSCRSINGVIRVGDHSQVKDLRSINGDITMERGVIVRGDVESINGSISCNTGGKIRGTLTAINGPIHLENTSVERHVKTTNGDIELLDNSIVQGDIIVKRSKGRKNRRHRLRIEIAQGSVVEGDIIVKDRRLDVRVILIEDGKVNGKIINAQVVDQDEM
jgi:DUF4097 and DUF4098 domain-containing protein YvlB